MAFEKHCNWTGVLAVIGCLLVEPAAGIHAAKSAELQAQLTAADAPRVEIVRERFPNGQVNIEREVTTDAAGNYVNHGPWRMWDAAGKLIAEGRFNLGHRTGRWMRNWNRDEAELLASSPFDQFEAPFVAEATYQDDQLHGEWAIVDAQGRRCSRVTLKHGKRNGPATLWLPNGSVLQDANFRNGSPVGDLCRRGADGQVRTVATYVGGQQLVNRIVYFPESKKKQLEAMYLVATTIELAPDDFWQLRFAEYRVQPEQLRHGSWKCWYSNGQLHSEGFFQYDRESGTFTWWHAHGQQAVKGTFVDGQPVGTWTWWHANGQKAAEGQYRNGRQVGMWQTWAVDGRLVQRFDTESPAVAGRNVRPPVQLIQQQASTETAR